MDIACQVGVHRFTICASTAGTNPALAAAVVLFNCQPPPQLSMRELIDYGNTKRAALATIAEAIGVMPLLVSEPHVGLAAGMSHERRRRLDAAATAASTHHDHDAG